MLPTCLCEVMLDAGLERLRRRLLPRVRHRLPVAQPVQQLAEAGVAAVAQLVRAKPVCQLQDLHHLLHLCREGGAVGAGMRRRRRAVVATTGGGAKAKRDAPGCRGRRAALSRGGAGARSAACA